MKTFATEDKSNYSVTDKEPESGYNLLFFRFLFDSFFKSNKSTVDFGQYDKMKVFIIEKENDDSSISVTVSNESIIKRPPNAKRKKQRKYIERFVFFNKIKKNKY